MGDGGTEDDRLTVTRLFRPVPDHLVGDRRAVHDLRHLSHVEIRQLVLRTDLNSSCTPTSITKVRGGTRCPEAINSPSRT